MPDPDADDPAAVTLSAAERLRILLSQFDGSDRAGKGRVVNKLRRELDVFRPALIDILWHRSSDQLVTAIVVAGWLRLPDAKAMIPGFTEDHRTAVRAAAIEAGQAYQLWSRDEFARFLADPEPDVLLAAIDAARLAGNAPVGAVLNLLEHADRRVQRASVQAFPPELAAEDWDVVRTRAPGLGPTAQAMLVEVLGEAPAAEAQECLLALLDGDAWNVRTAALRALAGRGEPVDEPKQIAKIATDWGATRAERIAAWVALESTAEVPMTFIKGVIDNLHPLEQVYAARCLIVKQKMSGLRRLVYLRTYFWQHEDRERARAAVEANRILAEIAGYDHGLYPGGWDTWLDGVVEFPTVALAAPTIF